MIGFHFSFINRVSGRTKDSDGGQFSRAGEKAREDPKTTLSTLIVYGEEKSSKKNQFYATFYSHSERSREFGERKDSYKSADTKRRRLFSLGIFLLIEKSEK
jgi:hypothetical protein